ncbi:unnamed protein product [Auanema sp. JU1783]|nr:unnamed protein product [Auanema sp. JU1783]
MLPILFLLFFTVKQSLGANILVYNPMYGQSHINLLGNIADILTKAGHNVTVFSAEITPDLKPFGTTEDKVHKVALGMDNEKINNKEVLTTISKIWDNKDLIAFQPTDLEAFYNCVLESHKALLKNEKLIQSLQNSNFDVAIHEFYDIGASAIMELFHVKKVVLVSAIGDILPYTFEVTGIPHFKSFVPAWLTVFGDQLNMWERFQTLQTVYSVERIVRANERKVAELFREYHEDFPDPKELLLRKSGVILANINEFTQTPRPLSSMIQFIGGSNLYSPKPLDENLDQLLNKRKYNVFFSLGSYVRLSEAPLRIKQLFAEAFSSMKDVTFLVKNENDDFDFNVYGNIMTKAWFPQKDLLGDDRIHLFITHGGQYRGKPMISIPIYADQILNAKSAVRAGSTTILDKRSLTQERLVRTIRSMLDPKSCQAKKAKFIQKSLEGREEEYRKKIVKWVELQAEAEEPFDHLIMHSRNLSVLELYNLDILGIIIMLKIKTLIDTPDYDSDDSIADGTSKSISSVPSNFRASSSSQVVDVDDFLVLDTGEEDLDSKKEEVTQQIAKNEKPVDKKLQLLLSKAVCKPDIEMTERNEKRIGLRAMKKQRKLEMEKTAGKKWFDMPATEVTDEVRMDLELLRMRSAIDPLAFYRKEKDEKLPKYFQFGRIVDAPEDYYSGRLTKAQRKRNMLDELLHNNEFLEKKTEVYNTLQSNERNKVKGVTMAKKFKRKINFEKNKKAKK